MPYIIQKRIRYWVSDRSCIGCKCLALGMYQHRGATMSGSRNTGSPDSPTCLNNAYGGCPQPEKQGYSAELKKQRKKDGMRAVM